MKTIVLILFAYILFQANVMAQKADSLTPKKEYKHSIDFCPISPAIGIYAIHYCYKFSPENEFIIAPSYMNIKHKGIGHTDAPGFIIGYRRYLW